MDAGVTVIACGGGGIPVMRDETGHIRGLEAVIDKDRTSALLAMQLGVKRLFITTGVDAVYRDYLTENRTALRQKATTISLKLKASGGRQFRRKHGTEDRSRAVLLERGGDEVVVICHPEALLEAFDGNAGTRIPQGEVMNSTSTLPNLDRNTLGLLGKSLMLTSDWSRAEIDALSRWPRAEAADRAGKSGVPADQLA